MSLRGSLRPWQSHTAEQDSSVTANSIYDRGIATARLFEAPPAEASGFAMTTVKTLI